MLCWVLTAAHGIFSCSMWNVGAWSLSLWATTVIPHGDIFNVNPVFKEISWLTVQVTGEVRPSLHLELNE